MKNYENYDVIIVGAGPYGAVYSQQCRENGLIPLIIDKRQHIAGNTYTEEIEGINVHKYGAHIFHTSNKNVWNYLHNYATFNNYINSPKANYKGKLYSLPFNMNTFYELYGATTPDEAKKAIFEDSKEYSHIVNPKNLEEQALKLGGKKLYETLIKGYTEKQWGRNPIDLPPEIIKRLPFRFIFDNNYFNDPYQGIPIGGYTKLFKNIIGDNDVRLGVDFYDVKDEIINSGKPVIFSGKIDEFFDYKFGMLEYRSLRFENKVYDVENYQGNAVINYTDKDIPYTRIIEHKHFEFNKSPKTVVSKEFSIDYKKGEDAYYPVNDDFNNNKYKKYKDFAESNHKNINFRGRLAEYKYYDMNVVIEKAISDFSKDKTKIFFKNE